MLFKFVFLFFIKRTFNENQRKWGGMRGFHFIGDLIDISWASCLWLSDSLSLSSPVFFELFLILFRIPSWGGRIISTMAAADALNRRWSVSAATPVCGRRCWAALLWWRSRCCWKTGRSSSIANATKEFLPYWIKDCTSASVEQKAWPFKVHLPVFGTQDESDYQIRYPSSSHGHGPCHTDGSSQSGPRHHQGDGWPRAHLE